MEEVAGGVETRCKRHREQRRRRRRQEATKEAGGWSRGESEALQRAKEKETGEAVPNKEAEEQRE